MNFSKHLSSALISAAPGGARWRRRLAVCALSVAAAACLAQLPLHRAQAQSQSQAQVGTLHGAAALERLRQDGQYDSLQAALNQARFNVSHTAQTPLGRVAWHAPNPAAGYDAYVTEEGVSIAVNDVTCVSLHLHSLGYGHALRMVGPGEVSGEKQTINLGREGGLQEWYVNGPDGLEQGFTLSEPPGARQQGVPLRLALQVSAGWQAVAGEDGKRVALRGAGAVVEYGKLVVCDSEGRNIPARLTVANEQVLIQAEDHDAAYPLTIDPLFTFQQRLQAADGAARDRFGAALALSGDTVVIGAPMNDVTQLDQGSVYVFVRSGATQPVWTQQQKLTAGDGMAGDRFGSAVALGGGTLVVGAPNDVTGSGVELGSASVFAFTGSWVPQEILTTGSGAANEIFAAAVVLSNDTVMAGAPGSDTLTQLNRGSVYAFVRPACPTLTPAPASLPDGASGASYQQQITISGGAGPFQFWLGGGALPPGLNLAQNGLLSGTPTTQGNYQFTIRATDLSSFCVAGRAYTLTIAPPCSRLRFNPPTLSHGKTGTAYSETLAVKGGAAPYQFSVTSALPTGLSLSASGVLSGTPTQAGNFSFTVLVRDANGCTGSRSYTISIS